ncbi:MAG: hypothetical protein ACHQ01_05975 [Candidatus Limnocylindrales bacterium]
MHWLSRHQTAVLLVGLVVAIWGSLWLVYDYRSPVSQFLRGLGTVQIEGWSAYDLDVVCVRIEPATDVPKATPDVAAQIARKAFPTGYVREVLLVSLKDTCHGGGPRLAWAVDMAWATSIYGTPVGGPPRAIVLVDATTGNLIASHAEGQQ